MCGVAFIDRFDGEHAIQVGHDLIVTCRSKTKVSSNPLIHRVDFGTTLFQNKLVSFTLGAFARNDINVENSESIFKSMDNVKNEGVFRWEVVHHGRVRDTDFVGEVSQRETVIAAS